MSERVLGWSLTIIGLLLSIMPIVAAFGVHGWNPVATVMPETDLLQSLFSQQGLENMGAMGDFQVFGDLSSVNPSHHYVHSWEDAETRLKNDFGQYFIGDASLGNAGTYTGHAPTQNIPDIGCAGDTTPDSDDTPTMDCANPNDGTAPVFEFSASPGTLTPPLPMIVPTIIGDHDPTNAVVVRSNIDAIETAFTNAGWDFYYPCEGFTGAEPHTPMGEVADAFLNIGDHQYHIRIFYGGHDSTYGDWYYMGAHYEGQNAVPSVGAPMTFNNPFNFPITIDNFAAEIYCSTDNYNLGQARLQQQTIVQSGGQGSINVIMGFTYDGFNHLLNNHLSGTSINTSLNVVGTLRLKIYEISITMTLEQTVPFPSDISVVI